MGHAWARSMGDHQARQTSSYVTVRVVHANATQCDVIILQNKSDAAFPLHRHAFRQRSWDAEGRGVDRRLELMLDGRHVDRDARPPPWLPPFAAVYFFLGPDAPATARSWSERKYLRLGPGGFVSGVDAEKPPFSGLCAATLFVEELPQEQCWGNGGHGDMDAVAAYSFREDGATCSTSVVEGQIAFTRIPLAAYSFAAVRVSPRMACLLAE